jgi:hypothetical protein
MYSYVRTAYVSVYTICYVRLASTELSFLPRPLAGIRRSRGRRIAAARPIRRRRPRPPTPAVRSGSDGRRPVKPGPPRPPLPVRRVNVARVQCSAGGGGDQLARRGGGSSAASSLRRASSLLTASGFRIQVERFGAGIQMVRLKFVSFETSCFFFCPHHTGTHHSSLTLSLPPWRIDLLARSRRATAGFTVWI